MLLRFRVTNHASIRDEQELSLVALDQHEDLAVADVPGTDQRTLPVLAVFGANASGKSNVIDALAFARRVVIESHQRWLPGDPIPRRPFLLDDTSRAKPSTFITDLVIDGVRYEYGFSLTDAAVTEEWLYGWPEQRRRMYFERDGDKTKYGPSFPSRRDHPVDRARSTGLVLSAGAASEHPLLLPLYAWFRSSVYPALNHTFDDRLAITVSELYGPRPEAMRALLNFADLGVKDVKITSATAHMEELAAGLKTRIERRADAHHDDLESKRSAVDKGLAELLTELQNRMPADDLSPMNLSLRLSLIHRTQASPEAATLTLANESSGTRTWLGLIGPMVKALREGSVLIIDELDAHLHPHLASQLIGLFQSPRTNARGAQLVFNTHDVTLMSRSTPHRLHRDQICFAEKDVNDGVTHLYPLTHYARIRDDLDNIERWYLSSRLGAVPVFLDSLLDELAEALAA